MKPCHPGGVRAGVACAALALSTLLASCAWPGNQAAPPLRTYMLDAQAPAPAPAVSAPRGMAGPVLLVEVPHAAPGYDSAHMVYVREPQTQEAYAHSVWADTPARMLAPMLVSRLQQGGQFGAVLPASSMAKATLRLDTTLLRLQQDFLQLPSSMHLRLNVTLMDNATRKVLAWRTVEVVQPSGSDDAAGGAVAAQAAVRQGLDQVADFLQTAVAALPAKE